MSDTKIEWASKTWNPVTGCSPFSSGCENCYAKRIAETQMAGRFGYPLDVPFAPTVHEDKFDEPLRWKKAQRIFISSMGDLFHDEFVKNPSIYERMEKVITACPHHTFMMLTKRVTAMGKVIPEYFNKNGRIIPNLWIGVTAENADQWQYRVEQLLKIPAACRFVSVEPMLSGVDLRDVEGRIDWVICGAETGKNARNMQMTDAIALMNQCKEFKIPFFFKKDSNRNETIGGKIVREIPIF
jgi:protein gp37